MKCWSNSRLQRRSVKRRSVGSISISRGCADSRSNHCSVTISRWLHSFRVGPSGPDAQQPIESEHGARRAAYDLKKLRGKQIVRRIGQTRRYESMPKGLKAMTALVVLRDKAIKPLLAATQELRPSRGALNPRPLDTHYDTIRLAMQGVFQELGLAA